MTLHVRPVPTLLAVCALLLMTAGCAAVQQAVGEAFEEPVSERIDATCTVSELTDGDMNTVGEVGFDVGSQGQATYYMVTIALPEKRFVRHVDVHGVRLAGFSIYVPQREGRRRLTWTGSELRKDVVRAKVGAEVDEFYLHVRSAEVHPEVVGKAPADSVGGVRMRDVNAYKPALIREIEVFARPE